MWDPSGRHLLGTADAGSTEGIAKSYHTSGSDLAARFADQFAVWRFAGGHSGRALGSTLVRLALRMPDSQRQDSVCEVAMRSSEP
jgi:hypothetical protein